MSDQSFAAEQLLELLLQLKKTTPAAARSILNAQPQIAYALMTLMVSMNAVNFEVFQKILAEYGSKSAPTASTLPSSTPVPSSSQAPTPAPAIPLHLQSQSQPYRTATPPSQSYPYPNGSGSGPQTTATFAQPAPYASSPANSNYGYSQPQPSYGYTSYNASGVTPTPPNPSAIPDTLASIPDEQKVLIMRVITMTPEQINALPPAERQTYIQLRATLGIAT